MKALLLFLFAFAVVTAVIKSAQAEQTVLKQKCFTEQELEEMRYWIAADRMESSQQAYHKGMQDASAAFESLCLKGKPVDLGTATLTCNIKEK